MTDGARTALVSGGTRGIGRAVALRLARDGFDVGFCYRSSDEEAALLEKEIHALGRRALAVRADVTDGAAVRDWFTRSARELGPVHAVVTSAGITRDKPLVLMTDDEWHDVLSTNLDGVYNVCRAAVYPMMKSKAGTIVNLSSVAGVYGNAAQTNYAASKAGIIAFTRSLAKEVGRYGIRVNAVAPGFIDTEMTSQMDEKALDRALGAVALGRMGRAEEVADLVSFLVSDRAAYISGSVAVIDGCMSL